MNNNNLYLILYFTLFRY